MIPNLPERFLAPKGWRTHSFVNEVTKHRIHYGCVVPSGEKPPSAVIVCLGGLSEFAEKYYEVAHDMLDRGYAFWFIDWHYQGRSGRMDGFPQRRHSDGFDKDVLDLHKFITDYVKPSSVHPDYGRIPLVMLGHSMGGNIGLQYLSDHPGIFDAAAFSAPFLGIHDFKWPMRLLALGISALLPAVGKKYVFSGKDWHESMRKNDGTDKFSSDAMRDAIHNIWSKTDPSLQVGNVTFGWVIKALKACSYLQKPTTAKKISIPVFIALAGKEEIVDNDCIRRFVKMLPNAELVEISGAHHEIMMEINQYRDFFFKGFDKMMEVNKIALTHDPKPV